jgi:hypothetical protein
MQADEPRSYSHNAVGLAAADRTQRPVDAAGAEDEDACPWEFQYSSLGSQSAEACRWQIPLANAYIPYTRPFPRIISLCKLMV